LAIRRKAPEGSVLREVSAEVGTVPSKSSDRAYEAAIQFLVSRGGQSSGQAYLEALVRFLGESLDVANVVCGRVADGDPPVIETIARYADGEIAPNIQ